MVDSFSKFFVRSEQADKITASGKRAEKLKKKNHNLIILTAGNETINVVKKILIEGVTKPPTYTEQNY